MKICIILPPSPGLFDQRSNIPLGPLYVAAVLERDGHDVSLVSLLGRDIPSSWPEADLYAVGFTTPQVGVAKGVMELIRGQYPGAKVLAAGAHPTALPIQTLQLGLDSVLVGEAERTITQVVSDLPNLKEIYHGVPVDNLDEIPFPARHLLPKEDLYNDASAVFGRNDKNVHVACLMTSRGCPGLCAFCSNQRLAHRSRSAQNVVAEMKELVDLGIGLFKIQDDTFTLRPRRVIELGDEIEKEFGPRSITTRIITRVDTFSEKIIPSMKKMGVDVVSFGIESGSQKILDLSNKQISIERIELALKMAHDAGFRTWGYIMFGLPGECDETVAETIGFLERNRPFLDLTTLSVFVPYAGCDIERRPEHYRMHILDHDWNRYWTVQKKTVLALPYEVSFDKMMDLKKMIIDAFIRLGYARKEWANDL